MVLSLGSNHYATGIDGPYGAKYNYMLYPDTEKPDTYYVLPETPTYNPMSDGTPSFNMIWWYGSGETEGGIWTFTVALPLPDLTKAGVRTALTRAINDDASVQARTEQLDKLARAYAEAPPKPEVIADCLKVLDIKDDEGRALTRSFDPKKGPEQFRPPTKQNLNFVGVQLKSGTVTVQGFKSSADVGNPNTVAFNGVATVTPSLVLNNAAVVTFNLDRLNCILVWQAMGGPSFARLDNSPEKAAYAGSVVTVKYAVEFDGMLPAAEAIVTLKQTSVAQVLTKEKSSYSSWSGKRTWDEVVGKDYAHAVREATEVRIPSSEYSVAPTGTKSVKDMLTEWAAAQLVDMLARQLPDIKLSDLMTDKPDRINQVQDQTRSYKLSTAIAITRNPQAQLPKLNGLGLSKSAMDSCFATVDLNQVPYFPVTVLVTPVARTVMTERKINSIVVTRVNFGTDRLRDKANPKQEVTTLPFVAEGTGVLPQSQLVGTFGRASEKNVVSYDYSVSYTDGTPTYVVENNTLGPRQLVVDLGAADLGVLRATLDGSWVPWGIVTSAKVEVKYLDLFQDTFLLTQQKQKVEIAKPLGRKVDQKLQYRLTLNLSNGAPLSYPPQPDAYAEHNLAAASAVPLRSPLGDAGTTEATFKMASGVTSASSRVEYAMQLPGGASRRFSKLIQLEAGAGKKSTETWTIATPPDGNPKFTFKRAAVANGQGEQSLPEQTVEADSSDPEFVFGLQKVVMR